MVKLFILISALLSGCSKEKPNFIYMPDMVYSPAYKAQEGEMRVPPVGTVPRTYQTYNPSVGEDGKTLRNPLSSTRNVLARGQAMFNTYCIVCHGPAGEGDGTIVPKFPRPPSLQSDKIRGFVDGQIFHIISKGQNLMPSYASQVDVADRWAIIHYVRVLQRSKHPTEEDVKSVN